MALKLWEHSRPFKKSEFKKNKHCTIWLQYRYIYTLRLLVKLKWPRFL